MIYRTPRGESVIYRSWASIEEAIRGHIDFFECEGEFEFESVWVRDLSILRAVFEEGSIGLSRARDHMPEPDAWVLFDGDQIVGFSSIVPLLIHGVLANRSVGVSADLASRCLTLQLLWRDRFGNDYEYLREIECLTNLGRAGER